MLWLKISGFDEKFKQCDLVIKEASKSGKCTSCARGKINRKLVQFVIPKIGEIVDILDDRLVIPGKKTVVVKDLKNRK